MLVGVFVQCESGVGETLRDLKKKEKKKWWHLPKIYSFHILYCAFDEPVLFQEALFILDHSVYCMCEWINPLKTFIVPQGNAVGS